MKKLTALLMAMLLILALAVPTALASEEPITLTMWHIRGSGAQYDCVLHAVNGFNETIGAEKGIVVEEAYQGSYDALWAAYQTAAQAGEAPEIITAANTYVAYMLEDDMIVDLAPLAEAEGYDLTGNLMDWLLEINGNTDGEIHSLPYCRSTPVFYYNKTIADQLGIEVPENLTIEKMEEICAQVVSEGAAQYGLSLNIDVGYLNAGWIYELGSEYLTEEGGSPSLEDGTMLRVLSDWRRWIDEGWCMPAPVTNAGDTYVEMFSKGELFAFLNSCASQANLQLACAETDAEVGVAQYPTYNEEAPVRMIGGANIAITKVGKTDEQIAASWEFVKYLMTDEEQFYNAVNSGYVPCTKSIQNSADMVAFWEENPTYKVAYDQMLDSGRGQENPYDPVGQDFTQICWDAASLLTVEQSLDAQGALDQIINDVDGEGLW